MHSYPLRGTKHFRSQSIKMRCTISYIGSKRKIAGRIWELIAERWDDMGNFTLVDAFYGAGNITRILGGNFRDVVLNDMETYSYLVACAMYSPALQLPESIEPIDGYVTQSYSPAGKDGRMFFTKENAMLIDGYREWLKKQPPSQQRDAAVGTLICSLDKVANTTSVYGAYLKFFKKEAEKKMAITSYAQSNLSGKVSFKRGDAVAACLDATDDSFLYLDPPYTGVAYSNNFFVLNVIGNIDSDPELYGVTGRPTGMFKSNWNNRERALGELCKILKDTPARRVGLSYSTDGLMPVNRIMEAFEGLDWDVTLHRIPQKRYSTHPPGTVVTNTKILEELFFLAERKKKTTI